MKPRTNLTANQLQIADGVATGRTVKEVAAMLHKQPQTIFNTLAKIYDALQIPHNLSALAVWRVCTLNKIELPEFIRGAGAVVLLAIFLTTIDIREENTMRARNRRGRHDDELSINQIEA